MNRGKIACIGAGIIGSSWALSFARAGYKVSMFDVSAETLERSGKQIDRCLKDLEAGKWIDSVAAVRSRISVTSSLEEAVSEAEYVQESVKEDLGLKRAVFEALDRSAPSAAILASSTSEIPASRFVERLDGRSRCLVAHPLNPPHLIPLVELCPSPWTSPEALATARSLLESAGQEPIVIHRELNGFVANRLQVAVILEALRLVAEGYCSPADVDRAMKRGLGLRWALMGPLETNHLTAVGGYEGFLREYGPTLQSIGNSLGMKYSIPAGTGARIDQSLKQELRGVSSVGHQSWRDRQLIRLRSLLDQGGEAGAV